MLFAFVSYKEQFSARVSGLIDKLIDLRMLNLQGERLADIVLTPPEENSPTAPTDAIEPSLEVRGPLVPLLPTPNRSWCSTARSRCRRASRSRSSAPPAAERRRS
jgi:hypothetical protein